MDSGLDQDSSMPTPLRVNLAKASSSPAGVRIAFGAVETAPHPSPTTLSAKPLISIVLSEAAARQLFDVMNQWSDTVE